MNEYRAPAYCEHQLARLRGALSNNVLRFHTVSAQRRNSARTREAVPRRAANQDMS
jgi:hypothetical protein